MSARQTILVIDDEPALLKSVKERLEMENYNVLTSQTAEQALQTLIRSGVNLPRVCRACSA